jgi:hypothetical protein
MQRKGNGERVKWERMYFSFLSFFALLLLAPYSP